MTTSPRALPLFERIRVASPCDVPWDAMRGDDHVRRCDQCDRTVYDLSSLTRAEVERLFNAHGDEPPCVTYFQRVDGTVLLADCPVGVRRRRWRPFSALAVATLAGVASVVACASRDEAAVKPEPRAEAIRAADEAPCEATATPGSMRRPVDDQTFVAATATASSATATPVTSARPYVHRTAGVPLRRDVTGRDSKGTLVSNPWDVP